MIIIKDTCMLHRHFMKTLPNYSSLKSRDKLEITQQSIDYLFKFTKASQFKNALKKIANTKIVIPAQKSLITKGHVTKDLKLHLLQRCQGLKAENVGASHKIFSSLNEKQIANLTKLSKGAILNRKELDNLLLTCMNNCRTYTKKFVRHSMTFLIKTGEHSFDDMVNLFILEGLQSLLFVYPRFESELHATNIMKATIHNVGQNYIETHTRLKRNRYSEGVMRVDSFTGIDAEGGTMEKTFADEDSNGRLYTKDSSEISQLEADIIDVTAKYTGDKARIIHLLMGNYDAEFTKYLNERGTTKVSNDEYFENAKTYRYIKLVFNFLNYDEEKGLKFIEKLKNNLSAYK